MRHIRRSWNQRVPNQDTFCLAKASHTDAYLDRQRRAFDTEGDIQVSDLCPDCVRNSKATNGSKYHNARDYMRFNNLT